MTSQQKVEYLPTPKLGTSPHQASYPAGGDHTNTFFVFRHAFPINLDCFTYSCHGLRDAEIWCTIFDQCKLDILAHLLVMGVVQEKLEVVCARSPTGSIMSTFKFQRLTAASTNCPLPNWEIVNTRRLTLPEETIPILFLSSGMHFQLTWIVSTTPATVFEMLKSGVHRSLSRAISAWFNG